MIGTNGEIRADHIVLVHVPRATPERRVLLPNLCFIEERHPLLQVPRVVVEFCINGMISGDPLFSNPSCLVCVRLDDLPERTRSQILNLWPTGVSFLGPVALPDKTKVLPAEIAGMSPSRSTPWKALSQGEKRAALVRTLSDMGAPVMDIVSRRPGLQDTTWGTCPDGEDLLSSSKLPGTTSAFAILAGQMGISAAGPIYDYPVGRYLHRLCAFFMGFRLMAIETYWTSFFVSRAQRALERFRLGLEQARRALTPPQSKSPAWQLVEEYSKAADFVMTVLVQLIDSGDFDLRFLPAPPSSATPDPPYETFVEGGSLTEDLPTRSRVLRRATAYHALRDGFRRSDGINPSHRYVRGVQTFARRHYGIRNVEPSTIDDLLGMWISMVDLGLPEFKENVAELKGALVGRHGPWR